MATEFPNFRVATTILVGVLALTACSSKNPDSLVGMNLDENAAMMDANAAVEANLGSADSSATAATSEHSAANAVDASAPAAAPKPPASPKPPRADQVDATDTDAGDRAELNQIGDNQSESAPDVPNMMQ